MNKNELCKKSFDKIFPIGFILEDKNKDKAEKMLYGEWENITISDSKECKDFIIRRR